MEIVSEGKEVTRSSIKLATNPLLSIALNKTSTLQPPSCHHST